MKNVFRKSIPSVISTLLTAVLLLGVAACAFAEDEAPALIQPCPMEVDVQNPGDGVYPASFDPAELSEEAGSLFLKNVHLYTKDVYDIVEISQLKVGDTIVIDGNPVKVEALERDGVVRINGGDEEGGWELRPVDEDNCYVVWGMNDIATYTDHGAVEALEISPDVVYTDDTDPGTSVQVPFDELPAHVADYKDYNFTVYNTTLCIEAGKIVEINQFYMP